MHRTGGSFERRYVLGVPVNVVTEKDTLDFIRNRVEERAPAHIVTVNAEFVIQARTDPEFRSVIEHADLTTPDGSGILWALSRQGRRLRRRVGGSDLVWTVSEQASELGHRVFLLGGGDGVARSAADRLVARYPRLVVAGTHAGSPVQAAEADICSMIRRSEAQILFVAFGAPEQELWISRNLQASGAAIGLGVGGSLDYLAGTTRRAPVWMQDHGLEWMWRLLRQPWRWRRMLALPRFAWLVLIQRDARGGS